MKFHKISIIVNNKMCQKTQKMQMTKHVYENGDTIINPHN